VPVSRLLLSPEPLSPSEIEAILGPVGFSSPLDADQRLQRLAGAPEERRALADVLPLLLDLLSVGGSAERGLRNLERYVDAAGSRLTTFRTLAEDPAALRRLVLLVSASEHFADILVREPRLLFWLEKADAAPGREALLAEAEAELRPLRDDAHALDALRRLKRRETLAVGHRDLVLGRPLEAVVRELSDLADALVEASLRYAAGRLRARLKGLDAPLPFAVLALGKLGGRELNYSSDIDLLFVHDERAPLGPGIDADEAFDRLARDVLRVLARFTDEGALYRTDLRLRPEGGIGALSRGLGSALAYYGTHGRTWERQALLKARPIAGDLALGARFVEAVRPFIYRRPLDAATIAEIQALKRRIEERAAAQPTRNVKEGAGGIRDIEFTVQFLQLLYGGDVPGVGEPSTLGAIDRLAEAGALTEDEAAELRESYVFLRRVEHGLQTLHSLQTHVLPPEPRDLLDLARRLGYGRRTQSRAPLAEFRADLEGRARAVKRILDRLLHAIVPEAAAPATAEEIDLLLKPDPPPEHVARVLSRYGFRDPERAMADLERLAREKGRYLVPSPRTRAFFAGLLPRLLRALGTTPSPDEALSRLERAAATLGAKSVFYQLLAENPDALKLFVDLCAGSEFLVGLVLEAPGLLDEVVDLLLTGAPTDLEAFEGRVADAVAARPSGPSARRPGPDSAPRAPLRGGRGAEPPEDEDPPLAALAQVQRAALLQIGIRDLGGRANVANTQAALTALAEAILRRLFELSVREAREKLGLTGAAPVPLALLGLGKLGAGELSYASDLDLVLVIAADDAGPEGLELGARAAMALVRRAKGLYEVDFRLRPAGTGGPLAVTLPALAAYYEGAGAGAATWERLAALKARPVAGDLEAGRRVVERLHEIVFAAPPPDLAASVRDMRARLEQAAAGPNDLKRGAGGLMDLDLLVAYLKLAHRGEPPGTRVPGTVAAVHALAAAGHLRRVALPDLLTAYQVLVKLEARLRVARNRPTSTLPDDRAERRTFARLLGYVDTARKPAEDALADEVRYHRGRMRRWFEEIVTAR